MYYVEVLGRLKFLSADDQLPAQINEMMGKRMVLHYSEYRNIRTNCFGETSYFVDSVKVAN